MPWCTTDDWSTNKSIWHVIVKLGQQHCSSKPSIGSFQQGPEKHNHYKSEPGTKRNEWNLPPSGTFTVSDDKTAFIAKVDSRNVVESMDKRTFTKGLCAGGEEEIIDRGYQSACCKHRTIFHPRGHIPSSYSHAERNRHEMMSRNSASKSGLQSVSDGGRREN